MSKGRAGCEGAETCKGGGRKEDDGVMYCIKGREERGWIRMPDGVQNKSPCLGEREGPPHPQGHPSRATPELLPLHKHGLQ